jgi:hypothetical protein
MFATDETQPLSGLVEAVNIALVAPAATVTLVGTVAVAVSLVSLTTAPPAGAAALNVTVPLEVFPAITLGGLRVSSERVATGVTVSVADLPLPP